MYNNQLGEALKKAMDAKKIDTSSFIWKGEKIKVGNKCVQQEEKIDEMSEKRLKECYEHCNKMLYNDNFKNLGRFNVLDEIRNQINKCNTELLLRYWENSYLRRENFHPTLRGRMMFNIRSFMETYNEKAEEEGKTLDWSTISVSNLDGDLPAEFYDISISEALDGCIDMLEAFNKQHLTMTFITKMGLWFTKAEEKELKGETNSNSERLKIAKLRLHLPEKLNLRLSEKGLSYHEMRSMLILPKKQKYSDMTTEQLLTLRNKVLPRLIKEIDSHIFGWKRLQKQIEIVAKNKNINLDD